MLTDLFPRAHTRLLSLPVLGPHLDGFAIWLRAQGYPRLPMRVRIRATRRLDALLQRSGVQRPCDLTLEQWRAYAPKPSQEDIPLAAAAHSWARYFEEMHALVPTRRTLAQTLLGAYRTYLEAVRGLAAQTVAHHTATVREWLASLGYEQNPGCLRTLHARHVEAFLERVGPRMGRQSLQHTVAHLRAFLRFLAGRGLGPAELGGQIDTPRVYRGERLPRALPWEHVQAFLRSIDRSTAMGRRDYAMFLLVVTYGLRCCEVVSLALDDLDWRASRLHVRRPKVRSDLVLPLTAEVGAALVAYLRAGRPPLPCRAIFLRVRAPAGPLRPTALTEAFQGWVRRSGLPIPYQGPHCLRHSLAVHLLKQGVPLKAIGDLLGHRSAESTCVYLRLQREDLREVALDLPLDAETEVRP